MADNAKYVKTGERALAGIVGLFVTKDKANDFATGIGDVVELIPGVSSDDSSKEWTETKHDSTDSPPVAKPSPELKGYVTR